MNRREAIAALVSLPAVAKISVAPVRPSDVIVVECDGHLCDEQVKRIRSTVEQVWPGQKVVVLDGQIRIKIVEGSQAPQT